MDGLACVQSVSPVRIFQSVFSSPYFPVRIIQSGYFSPCFLVQVSSPGLLVYIIKAQGEGEVSWGYISLYSLGVSGADFSIQYMIFIKTQKNPVYGKHVNLYAHASCLFFRQHFLVRIQLISDTVRVRKFGYKICLCHVCHFVSVIGWNKVCHQILWEQGWFMCLMFQGGPSVGSSQHCSAACKGHNPYGMSRHYSTESKWDL